MSVKTTVYIGKTDALEAIQSAFFSALLKIPDKIEYLREAADFFEWRERILYDTRATLKDVEIKLEEIRDIHNPDGDYYFENYIVVEDEEDPDDP